MAELAGVMGITIAVVLAVIAALRGGLQNRPAPARVPVRAEDEMIRRR